MRSFLHFRAAAAVRELLNEVFLSDDKNSVSFFHLGRSHELRVGVTQDGANSLRTTFQAVIRPEPAFSRLELDTAPSASIELFRSFADDQFSLLVSGSTSERTSDLSAFKSGCKLSADARYSKQNMDLSLFLGAKHSKEFSVLTSVSLPTFSASLGGLLARNSNVMETSILFSNGLCGSLKTNFSIPSLIDLKIGWIFRFSTMIGYLTLDFWKKELKASAIKKMQSGVDVAVKTKWTSESFSVVGGLTVSKRTDFRWTIANDGTMQMRTKFKPVEWLSVSLRSAASVANRLDPVAFGWSLAFELPDELPMPSITE